MGAKCSLWFVKNSNSANLFHIFNTKMFKFSKYYSYLENVFVSYLPIVKFLQSDPQLVDHRFGLVRLSSSSHTAHPSSEHHVENVHGGAKSSPTSPCSSLLDSLLPSFIIYLFFLWVWENLIGLKSIKLKCTLFSKLSSSLYSQHSILSYPILHSTRTTQNLTI